MTHMKLCNRQRLGFLAELGWTMRRIAQDMGWSAQTISDELRNRRVDSDMPYAGRSRQPYDIFIEKHGAKGTEFLDALGIVRIPANQVTLHPFLLGQKYQRAADRAILKKNGVIAKKPKSDK